MWHRTELTPELLQLIGSWEHGLQYLLPGVMGWKDQSHPQQCFVDDPAAPRLLLATIDVNLLVLGDPALYPQAIADLAGLNFDPPDAWPDDAAREVMAKHEVTHTQAGVEALGPALHELAWATGFTDKSDRHESAYFFWLEGPPRFAGRIKHPCRAVEGLELYELMCQATDYDASGEYTKKCLEYGPSFVCEVDGEPVCWSCTHLSDAMGMIYTPEEHRRKGYARSLAAFQIDYMLQRDGLAWCFVLGFNTPSIKMMESFNPGRIKEQVYWRQWRWPE